MLPHLARTFKITRGTKPAGVTPAAIPRLIEEVLNVLLLCFRALVSAVSTKSLSGTPIAIHRSSAVEWLLIDRGLRRGLAPLEWK